jgi:hypothetical protein
MKRLLPALVLALGALGANDVSAQVGQKANLDVVQWLNTPPITLEQLQGHTVLVEVFRTW